jgi:hypothetical protein
MHIVKHYIYFWNITSDHSTTHIRQYNETSNITDFTVRLTGHIRVISNIECLSLIAEKQYHE